MQTAISLIGHGSLQYDQSEECQDIVETTWTGKTATVIFTTSLTLTSYVSISLSFVSSSASRKTPSTVIDQLVDWSVAEHSATDSDKCRNSPPFGSC